MRKNNNLIRRMVLLICLGTLVCFSHVESGEIPVLTEQDDGVPTAASRHSWEERQLRAAGFGVTEEKLRSALQTESDWTRILALRVIKDQRTKALTAVVQQQLESPSPFVRVEAGMTLVALSNPQGQNALRREVARGQELAKSTLTGSGPPFKEVGLSIRVLLQAAGALLETGDDSGMEFLKLALFELPHPGMQTAAAIELTKCKSNCLVAEELLLRAAKTAVTSVSTASDDIGKVEYSESKRAKIYRMKIIFRSLAKIGGARAIELLSEAASYPDMLVKEPAKLYLNVLQARMASHNKLQQDDADPAIKGSNP